MPNNKIYYFNDHVDILCANGALHLSHRLFSVSEITIRIKMNCAFHFGTKNDKIEKWRTK